MIDLIAWYQAGGDGPMALWRWGGIVALVAWLWVVHRVMRRLMGYRRFRGTWYSEAQFEVLVKSIYDDQQRGHRVMRADEIALLRQWQGVSGSGISRDSGSMF